jgi:parvulin-like peptidyl-prolyl isomerase
MKPTRVIFALLVAMLALLVTACGGGADVPAGAVAVVNGTDISRSELDGWIGQAKKSYEAQKQEFPKVGTPEYQSIQTQYVAFLVQRAEFEQTAEDLDVTVSEKDIDKGVADFVDQKFNGSRKQFEQALKAQDFSEERFRQTIRLSVLSHKIYDKVTKDVTVPGQELLDYYNENYKAASREVRHILISVKAKNGQVDYAKSKAKADDIYDQLKNGADFAALAKKYSADPSSKSLGGKYTAVEGRDVPEFDKVAFELKTGEISKPVKTTYGYHVIQALKAANRTPFTKVQNQIRTQLLQQKKNQVIAGWVEDLKKKYESKISYATGFAPPAIPDTSSTETQSQ